MAKVLNPEDIAEGQFVTVLNWTKTPSDRSYKGDVLIVQKVTLPYVLAAYNGTETRVLDLREVELMPLDREYVASALLGKYEDYLSWSNNKRAAQLRTVLEDIGVIHTPAIVGDNQTS